MKKLKKALRLLFLICLILLASVGIGMVGGIPLPISDKRKQTPDINIELVEPQDEESDVKEFESIS